MSKRILVIEDDERVRRLVNQFLRLEGYEVLEARDGLEGMEMVRREAPDLVILDMVMPGKDGMETLMDLAVEAPELGILAMSGGDGTGPQPYLDMATRFGANRVLPKPFGRSAFIRAVQETMKSAIESRRDKLCP